MDGGLTTMQKRVAQMDGDDARHRRRRAGHPPWSFSDVPDAREIRLVARACYTAVTELRETQIYYGKRNNKGVIAIK